MKLHYGVGKYKKSYDRPFISFQMMQQAVLLWFSEEEEKEEEEEEEHYQTIERLINLSVMHLI